MKSPRNAVLLLLLAVLLAGCGDPTPVPPLPTGTALAQPSPDQPTATATLPLISLLTATPQEVLAPPTSTPPGLTTVSLTTTPPPLPATALPSSTPIILVQPSNTPAPTVTLKPAPTNTAPAPPTNTPPPPTNTPPPVPTSTPSPAPTSTPLPATATALPPTNTPLPLPSDTPQPPTATPKPEFSGLLVGRGNDTNLYVVEPNSDAPRLLTSVSGVINGGQPRNPRWSTDGSVVVFWVRDTSRGSFIFTVNADGSNRRQLIDAGDKRLRTPKRSRDHLQVQNPVWSPDGRYIAFSSIYDNGDGNYWVISADGESLRQLTRWADGLGPDNSPVLQEWSPDGSVIAIQTKSDRISLISQRGGDEQFVTNGFLGGWGPGGRLYLGKNGDTSFDSVIYSVNGDGGDLQAFAAGALSGATPRWSPDGKYIYYAATRNGYSLANADGSSQRPFKTGSLTEVDWR